MTDMSGSRIARIVGGIRAWLGNVVDSAMLERAGLTSQNLPSVKDIRVAVFRQEYGYDISARLRFFRPPLPSSAVALLEAKGSVLEPVRLSVSHGSVTGEISRFSALHPCAVTLDADADWSSAELLTTYKWTVDAKPGRANSGIAVLPEGLRGILNRKSTALADLPTVTLDLADAGDAIQVAGLSSHIYEPKEAFREAAFLQAALVHRVGEIPDEESPVFASDGLIHELDSDVLRRILYMANEYYHCLADLLEASEDASVVLVHPDETPYSIPPGCVAYGLYPKSRPLHSFPMASQLSGLWWGAGCRITGHDSHVLTDGLRQALALECLRRIHVDAGMTAISWLEAQKDRSSSLALRIIPVLSDPGIIHDVASFTKSSWGKVQQAVSVRQFLSTIGVVEQGLG